MHRVAKATTPTAQTDEFISNNMPIMTHENETKYMCIKVEPKFMALPKQFIAQAAFFRNSIHRDAFRMATFTTKNHTRWTFYFHFCTYLVCLCCDFIIILLFFVVQCFIICVANERALLYSICIVFRKRLGKFFCHDKRSFICFYFHINLVIGWKIYVATACDQV